MVETSLQTTRPVRRSERRCFKCQNRFYATCGKDHGEAGCSLGGQEEPHQNRYTHCSLCRNPHRSSFSDRTESHGRPTRSSLFLKDHTPWKTHALEQFLKNLPGGKDTHCNSSWRTHGKDPGWRQGKSVKRRWQQRDSVMNWPQFHSPSPCTVHWAGCRKVRNEEVMLSLGRTRWEEKVYLLTTILLFFKKFKFVNKLN